MVQIGDYGTAFKDGIFRCGVYITKIEGDKYTGKLLKNPKILTTFRDIYFIPHGNFAGISKLEEQIKTFEIEVPTKKVKPSQTCPNCGHQKKKTLAEREHHCDKCGYRCDRDVAAAMVMLNYARGMERASIDSDEKTSTWCGSYNLRSSSANKQVAQAKSRKRVAQS